MTRKSNRAAVPPAPTFGGVRVMLETEPALNFCGRPWLRGIPQTIPPELWRAMQARGAERVGFVRLTEENDHV